MRDRPPDRTTIILAYVGIAAVAVCVGVAITWALLQLLS